jgi:hypothetical protein
LAAVTLVLYQGTADVAADGARNQSQKPSDYWARHRKSSQRELAFNGRLTRTEGNA